MYVRKTVDTWVLEGNYGYGWEYILTEYTRKEGRERLREYVGLPGIDLGGIESITNNAESSG